MSLVLPGLRLPTGEVTKGSRDNSTLRLRNARLACSMRLEGMRVLNLGCSTGVHSFYMASSAVEVIGVDHSARSIAVAEETRKALGATNVRFICGDFRDAAVLGDEQFDLVVAWGFLHRVANPFSLLDRISRMSDALSLEWRTPVLPFMSKLRVAYHTGNRLDPRNVAPLSTGMADSPMLGIAADTGFWDVTPGAVKAICRSVGYEYSRLLGYGEQLESGAVTVLRHWAAYLARLIAGRAKHQLPLGRVHMLFEKRSGLVGFDSPLYPEWDVALRERLSN